MDETLTHKKSRIRGMRLLESSEFDLVTRLLQPHGLEQSFCAGG
jgi:hypothetical protein